MKPHCVLPFLLAAFAACVSPRPSREPAARVTTGTPAVDAGAHDESFKAQTPRAITAARAKELDDFIVNALARLDVPGAVVAVVEGGKVVYEKAFGVRSLGQKDVVTPKTLFMIGSITKPMTTMMEATLVDTGKFGWETPVTSLLASFALGDADITKKVTLWQMSCACTGMPRQDMEDIFEFAHVTPEQRIASMRTMKPTTAFGETFQYSNLMVAAGGYAAAHGFDPKPSLGDAYDAVMQKKVFGPIGMESTTLDFSVAEGADHAMPHALSIDGVARQLPLMVERDVLPIRPSGGVWSNVRDMERYAMTEISKGVAPSGERVVSEANLVERWKERVRTGTEGSYGLGINVATVFGLPSLRHDGGSFGFGASLFMLPQQRIAIIVLTNIRNGGGFEQLPFNVVVERKAVEEIFDGAEDVAISKMESFAKAKGDAVTSALNNVEPEPDAAWVKRLVGTYSQASLGKVEISAAPKGGMFDAGEWKTAFGRRRDSDGTTKLVFFDPPFAGTALLVGGGDPPTITIQDDRLTYVFERAVK